MDFSDITGVYEYPAWLATESHHINDFGWGDQDISDDLLRFIASRPSSKYAPVLKSFQY
jgi:hypothetical protein